MYKRILVPLDGSELSEMALPYAQQLAEGFGASVDLVSAIQGNVEAELPDHITDAVTKELESYLQRTVDSISPKLQPRFQVTIGYPAEAIIDEAHSQDETIIVMATHAYSGLKRLLLGSVAHKVVQASEAPVLLVPAGIKSPNGGPVELRKAIVPLDGSELAEHILPLVIQLCETLDMELILARAYSPELPGSSIRMHDISQIVHDAAESYLKEKAAELKAACTKQVTYKALRGIPAEQIVDFALETPNSITAMCTHGRHGPGRWLLGSVTDAVVHCSEEPVLVIRGSRPPTNE